jgi:(p)ppGpp synthase/HD superfamily hydrolase
MQNAFKWCYLLDYGLIEVVSSLLHDSVEDVHGINYNFIKDKYGYEVAEVVFACTELRGRNRTERHNQEYFDGLKANKSATFVKLCDIIANMEQGKLKGSNMLKKYIKEYPHVKEQLYVEKFKPMFDYIENNFIENC